MVQFHARLPLSVLVGMDTSYKIVYLDRVRREDYLSPIVATNGCFDILHTGHIGYLEKARSLGRYLVVGLNSDDSVRTLKGDGRPVNKEMDRARVLAALECVDRVVIFTHTRATLFLETVRPHIYVKGGDYTLDTLYRPERDAVERHNGKIVILPLAEGFSTTSILLRARGET